MKNRILKFLEVENINPSKFADEIGVQRSSISHILSGRNNPSLDLIQKILSRFNYINAEWLITGKGEMFKSNREPSLFDSIYNKEEQTIEKDKSSNQEETITKLVNKDTKSENINTQEPVSHKFNEQTSKPITTNDSRLVKIILLYANGKAEIYQP